MSHFCFVNKVGRLAHAGIIFGLVRKSVRNGKETSVCLKKVLRNYALSWHLTFRKAKPDFEIQLCANFFGGITEGIVKLFTYVLFCLTFSPCVYLIKNHFASGKSYRTSLIIGKTLYKRYITLYPGFCFYISDSFHNVVKTYPM